MAELKINLVSITAAAEFARLHGICDETAYRNRIIKLEFEQMKIDCTGESVETIMQKLSEKKWNGIVLGYASIERICFPRGKEKEKVEMAIQLSKEEPAKELSAFSIQHSAKPNRRTYAKRR